MSADNLIVTERLSRRFSSFQAVKDVNLRVPAGVVYGFLGPNGAGKTTTIRMLLDLIRPSSGQVYLFGQPFSRKEWRRLRHVGALVESPSLYPHLTGRENLEVIRRMLDLPRKNIDRVLQIVRMVKDGNRLVKHYSLGMKQRLALALAMLNEPQLLILDEPTNGLDPAGIQEIRAMIRDMPRQMGVTVFLSSHLLSEVELMATHVGIIQQGSLLFQGKLSELKQRWGSTVQISVDRAEEAAAFLSSLGWLVKRNGAGQELLSGDERQLSDINQALTQNGFRVSQLYLRQAGLEEMFIELTGGK
jgi:ABC-2 type transport system ATP-binding protein